MRVKTTALDKLFSQLVRERACWTCESCGKYHVEGERRSLHCSHLWSRRNRSTRWHPDNAFAHCFSCHQRLGENPTLFHEWAEATLGKKRFVEVRLAANTPRKWSRGELEDMKAQFQAEINRLRDIRAQGRVGRLEFETI